MSLIDLIARLLGKKRPSQSSTRFDEAELAGSKRMMERRLRGKGLSRMEAKKAVRLHFSRR